MNVTITAFQSIKAWQSKMTQNVCSGPTGGGLCAGTGSSFKVEEHKMLAQSAGRKIFDVPLHFYVVPLRMRGHYKNRVGKADYETCNITVLLIF